MGKTQTHWDLTRGWLERITYRDNVILSILPPKTFDEDSSYPAQTLPIMELRAQVKDSRDRGSSDWIWVKMDRTVPIYQLNTFLEFAEWVRATIREWELHEMDEWIRVDGQLTWDPHRATTVISSGSNTGRLVGESGYRSRLYI